MKYLRKVLVLVSLLVLTLASFSGVSNAESKSGLSKEEKELLNEIKVKKDKLNFGLDKNLSAEELGNLRFEGKDSIKAKELEKYIKKSNSLIQIQIFEDDTNTQVFSSTLSSLKEIQDTVELVPTEEIEKSNASKAYYKVPYTMIISTIDYTGFYTFDRFYINDMDAIDEDVLKGISSYLKESNYKKHIDISFIKNQEEIEELKTGEYTAQCIACIGDIYEVDSTSYYTKWTDIAEVHAITDVTTTFTLSLKDTTTTTIQVKVVSPAGSIESSGSTSKTVSEKVTYPAMTGTYLSSPGKIAQTEVEYAKTVYKKVKGSGPEEYTKVYANKVLGGNNWGSTVYGNGSSFNTVSGSTYLPNSVVDITQDYSNTFTNQASTSVYGTSVGLNVTVSSSDQNNWNFKFGNRYTAYKVYNKGSKNNLTAK